MRWVLTKGDGYLLLSFSPKQKQKQIPKLCWSIWVMTVSLVLFEAVPDFQNTGNRLFSLSSSNHPHGFPLTCSSIRVSEPLYGFA